MSDDIARVWVRDFDDGEVRKLAEAIENVRDTSQSVLPVYIHSVGGSLYKLYAMLDLFASCQAPIATIALGSVQSAAVDLLAAGSKGHRYIGPSTTVMVHDSSDGWSPRKNTEVQAQAKQAQIERDRSFASFAKNTGKSKVFWDRFLAKRQNVDTYLTAKQAVELGIADHVSVPALKVDVVRTVRVA
jgi:ATP-dependent Clp protease protease subunit